MLLESVVTARSRRARLWSSLATRSRERMDTEILPRSEPARANADPAEAGAAKLSADVARRKVNRQLALACGQGFVVEEPQLRAGEPPEWSVPIWVARPDGARVAAIGEVRVDADTGEVLTSPEQMRLFRAAANKILRELNGESA
jgi:hypothetical protein